MAEVDSGEEGIFNGDGNVPAFAPNAKGRPTVPPEFPGFETYGCICLLLRTIPSPKVARYR